MAKERESNSFGVLVNDAAWATTLVALRVRIGDVSDVEPLLGWFSWILRTS
jgi:hypothetical protein